ncbi:MSC_0619 family F1-like ATPase alpha subunit [Metamycoplasma hyosynoviae]|uniref:ATP F0F1 synthase subunit alpha n=1 Tax=Metamycoplasma hyosynoviae TaxID=29559 RepID=A0A063YF00_9BACT|nr:ATP F0F1 synthase subunit alpha [Metamycoplasma hyosynoviae]ASI53818.1 ATP F0F1 synthase subunit alpha [Metamycoplasma hyosynoviae]KDE41592.1 ATP F0F1 synthase subunit alpha [Metamycoplasma hyosynoviae]KDE43135.1 ATP F0F1 synthase subunit alpha [Metamycoplasma hyosynoviae]KDE43276.1 ATP F0F1 synthase subunit alpha [Metamycoplasma hyosynoviae]KDE43536.1 ATP F0F1 synthase subunit alpha [Metamycoplasma hyosynoviae]
MAITKSQNPRISAIFDYIVEVQGEYDYKQRQLFTIKDKPTYQLMLVSSTKTKAFLLTNNAEKKLNINDELIEISNENLIYTSDEYYGKIIDVNGNIVLPKPQKVEHKNPKHGSKIFGSAHDLTKVKTLNTQLYTGIISIDLLIPIGKGQRELIIGDRQTGKTHIATNTIINQAKENTKCIYVAIGQKREDISRLYNTLKSFDVLKNVIILDAPATSAYEQYLAPYVGMAHAENISHEHDVLIIFDDLSKHANIYREIALLTDKPVGKEAMPGDMFFAHSSLLERSGSFVNKKTITALPIVKTVDGDITSSIASNIISITDGQIVTSSDLFSSGKLPAIDIDLSVSRTGSSVQSRSITNVAREIGKIYKTYKRHLKLAMLDYEFNKETTSLLHKGKLIEKMFNQKGYSLYSYHFVLLMSKIITWNVLEGVKDEQKALMFLDYFIANETTAKLIFNTILTQTKYDDNMYKNYFAFGLKQYSQYIGLEWDIEVDQEFLDLSTEFLENAAIQLGDK